MSSARFATLTLDLAPSRILLLSGSLCHVLAVGSLLVTEIPGMVKWVLGAGLALSCLSFQLCYGVSASSQFIRRVEWAGGTRWRLYGGGCTGRTVRLLGSYVHPRLLIMSFGIGRFRRRSVLVLPDSGDSEGIRRLRARLLANSSDS